MSWFEAKRAEPPSIEQRAAAMGIPMEPGPGRHCDACKCYRVAEGLELVTRAGVDLVICKTPGPCIAAAKAARLWKE